jgi:hypothetical protein
MNSKFVIAKVDFENNSLLNIAATGIHVKININIMINISFIYRLITFENRPT